MSDLYKIWRNGAEHVAEEYAFKISTLKSRMAKGWQSENRKIVISRDDAVAEWVC